MLQLYADSSVSMMTLIYLNKVETIDLSCFVSRPRMTRAMTSDGSQGSPVERTAHSRHLLTVYVQCV